MAKIAVIILAVVLIATFFISNQGVEASGGYRKPPFNGSIFGKRNSGGCWILFYFQVDVSSQFIFIL
jgi:hypothetical protein